MIVLLGDLESDLAGSEFLSHRHGLVAGRPRIDLEREVVLQSLVRSAIASALLRSAHDCSDGGLAVALAESAFRGGVGATCRRDLAEDAPGSRRDAVLFGERQSRVLVSLAARDVARLEKLAADLAVPCRRIGVVGGERLIIDDLDVSFADAQAAWSDGLAQALREER